MSLKFNYKSHIFILNIILYTILLFILLVLKINMCFSNFLVNIIFFSSSVISLLANLQMSKAIEINNERLECVNHFGKKEYVEWNCLKMGNPSLTGWLFKNLKNKLTIISILNFSSKDRRKINNAIKYLLTLNGLKKRGRINNVYIKV